MRYCPHCKIDLFGGSVCHQCGGRLVEKRAERAAKAVHVTQDMIIGGPKKLKSELAQSLIGRILRLLLEIVLFCALFYAVSWVLHVLANFLSVQMSEEPDEALPPIDWASNAVRYYLYIGWAVVAALTIKCRWNAGK